MTLDWMVTAVQRLQPLSMILYLSMGLVASVENDTCSGRLSDREYLWRIVCTSIFLPLLLEYVIDDLAWIVFPSMMKNACDDSLSHWIILTSLVCSTNIPIFLFGPLCLSTRWLLISLGHTLSVYGVISRIEALNADLACFKECHVIVSMYLISESFLLYGSTNILFISCALLLKMGLIALLLSSINIIKAIYVSKSQTSSIFADRRYVNFVLLSSLTIFIVWDIFCTLNTLTHPHHTDRFVDQRLLAHVVFVVLASVLPGRITRRGLLAAEENNAILNEMNYKKTFVRYISHEVRSPLSTTSLALDCMIDLLTSRGPGVDYSEVLELAQDCKSTCTTAIQTLSDLLLYDKIESKMLRLECADICCYDFVDHCIRPLEKQIKLSGLHWEATVDSLVHDCMIFADQIKMEQVLRNFISNAIKFTPPGGKIVLKAMIDLTHDESKNMQVDSTSHSLEEEQSNMEKSSESASNILVSPQPAGVHCRFRVEVTDNGPGISLENQSKLFGQYVQFDANKLQRGGGSGLGLWLSKSIVEAHGGVVGVHSAGLGHGSTFFFEIPGRLNENHHTAEGTEETETISTDYYTGLLSPRSHAAPRTPTASANKTGSTGAEDLIDDTQSLNASSMSSPALSPSSSHVGLDVLVDESEPPTLRVLIADDAPVARKIVERLLLSASIYVDADGRIDLPSTFSAAANAGSNAVSTAAGNPRSFASTALQLFLPRKERSPSYDSTASSGNATLVPARKERSLSNISTSMVSVSSSDAGFQPTSPQTVTTLRDASEDPQASTTPSAHRLRSFSTVERNFTRSISVDIGSPERRNAPSLLPPAHTINMATPTWPIAPNASTGSLQQSTSSVGIADAAFIEVSPRALTMSPQLSSPIIQALPEPFFPATPLQPSQVPSATTSSSLLRLMVEVEHATNGQICVDKLSQSMLPWRKTFDVVLVDYYMPVLDGEAAIRQIRQHKYDGVVIALTGATSKEDAERLLSAGATAVMPKPFDLSSFLRILAEYYRCSTVLASLRGATSTLHSSPPRNIAGSSSLAPLARTVLEGADDGQENPV